MLTAILSLQEPNEIAERLIFVFAVKFSNSKKYQPKPHPSPPRDDDAIQPFVAEPLHPKRDTLMKFSGFIAHRRWLA
ncbi:hypothetical protein [Chromobacterium vaccinii]|uniref:hypothetical protein n=1 Tax=Chromobacterium vaccinii TaxID=1108595 RepID=UPI001E4A7735|nr:hypothetical protein [Chromobacterium vaccinii]MCD4499769.1 hypothetical protein [Chromobacterium vaccinii]